MTENEQRADEIVIRNLRIQGILGVLPHERTKRQEICLSISLGVDLSEAANSDDLGMSIDYADVTKVVSRLVEDSSFLTAEALATEVAKACLENPKAKYIRICVEKPQAIKNADSVGVVITRRRSDFV